MVRTILYRVQSTVLHSRSSNQLGNTITRSGKMYRPPSTSPFINPTIWTSHRNLLIANSTPQVLQTPEEYDSLIRRCKRDLSSTLDVSTDPQSLDPVIESTYRSRATKTKGHWKTKAQSPPKPPWFSHRGIPST